MQCAQWNANRAAAWMQRRVAVAYPVRMDFVRICVFCPVSKKGRKSAKCRNGVPGVGRCTELASVLFGKRRSDARFEPALPALSLAWKWRIRAAPRTGTRADAREHSAVTDGTSIKVYSRHPTVPLCCLPGDDAAIAARQARMHLHVAIVYGAQSGSFRNTTHSLARPCECLKCENSVHAFGKTENSGDCPAFHRATFLCTSRRRRHRNCLTTSYVHSSILV